MSFSEIKKTLNTNFNEPLNINQYIKDISTFGSKSYVLSEANEDIWRNLITTSLALFGNSTIHKTVYDRLTDDDIDYMIENSGSLGQILNKFYNTDLFVDGNIDELLSGITSESNNKIELKIIQGISRYITSNTSDENAGAWLDSVFGTTELSAKGSMENILSDNDIWNNVISGNESLRTTICHSATAIYFASNGIISDLVFNDFIESVIKDNKTTIDLISQLDLSGRLDRFFNNEVICQIISNNEYMIKAICYNLSAFTTMINNETALSIIINSDIASDVIVSSIEEVARTENKLINVKSHISSINEDITSIASGETVVDKIKNTKDIIDDCILDIQNITSKADKLALTIDALFNNESAMNVIMNNDTMVSKLFDIEDTSYLIYKIYKSDIAFNAFMNRTTDVSLSKISSALYTAATDGKYFTHVTGSKGSYGYKQPVVFRNYDSSNFGSSYANNMNAALSLVQSATKRCIVYPRYITPPYYDSLSVYDSRGKTIYSLYSSQTNDIHPAIGSPNAIIILGSFSDTRDCFFEYSIPK